MATGSVRASAVVIVLASAIALIGGCGAGKTQVVCLSGCCSPTEEACFAPQYVYATGLQGQVSIFPVDGNTGGLSAPSSTSGPRASLGMVALNNQFLYVSNPPFSGSAPEIDAWSIDGSTGALSTVPGSPFALGALSIPGGLAADNLGSYLYVADAIQIDGFKADATGALTAVPGSPFPSGSNLYLTVDPQDRFVFAADNDPPVGVFAFTIDAGSGALTAVQGSPFAAIPGFLGNTQPGQIVVDGTGNFVYEVLTSTNQIAAFSIVAPAGTLNLVPGSPFATGGGPLPIVTVNSLLYVSNANDGTISGYSINPTSGVLTPLANSPFAIRAGALTTDPGGNYLYASTASGMMAYRIDGGTGNLTPISSPVPYTGATVLAFVE